MAPGESTAAYDSRKALVKAEKEERRRYVEFKQAKSEESRKAWHQASHHRSSASITYERLCGLGGFNEEVIRTRSARDFQNWLTILDSKYVDLCEKIPLGAVLDTYCQQLRKTRNRCIDALQVPELLKIQLRHNLEELYVYDQRIICKEGDYSQNSRGDVFELAAIQSLKVTIFNNAS